MSEHIKIDNETVDIMKWLFGSKSEVSVITVRTIPDAEPSRSYYCVLHTIYVRKSPLLRIGRIYLAINAEQALKRYMTEKPVHEAGTYETYIGVKLSGYFGEGYQEFEAFKLPTDENSLSGIMEYSL